MFYSYKVVLKNLEHWRWIHTKTEVTKPVVYIILAGDDHQDTSYCFPEMLLAAE